MKAAEDYWMSAPLAECITGMRNRARRCSSALETRRIREEDGLLGPAMASELSRMVGAMRPTPGYGEQA